MADPHGFMKASRSLPKRRPVDVRIMDWREVYEATPEYSATGVREQAARCMDCGIPFCHGGCPLGNLIPEWNDLVRRDDWRVASDRLHATNNFPEFTGRICPAPCEAACVLSISDRPVTIEQIEKEIAERAWSEGWLEPQPPQSLRGKSVAIIGSGPAGLAAAQQLTRAGYAVTVYEKATKLGGLLRFGIPEFKMEKWTIDRRTDQMSAEGTQFVTSCNVGVDMTADQLRSRHDAVLLAVGAEQSRVPDAARSAAPGVHLAMDYLVPANKVVGGELDQSPIDARGKHVVIVGGGDTAADCLGTAHRQGAASVVQLDIYPQPPDERDDDRSPWPSWPWVLRTYPAHEEGGNRQFEVTVEEFVVGDDGRLCAVRLRRVAVEKDAAGDRITTPIDEPFEIPCDLGLLAIGFEGVAPSPVLDQLGISLNRGRIDATSDWSVGLPGIFVAGDAKRGASLVVWAIAEGRAAAAAIDIYFSGATQLPVPVRSGSGDLH